jgi:hypothetical protein
VRAWTLLENARTGRLSMRSGKECEACAVRS